MYLKCTIPVPRIPGKITFLKVRGTTYVNYEYDRVYLPERRYSIPRRAGIGKLVGEDLLQPNENLHRYLPRVDIPEEDGPGEPSRSSCLCYGSWLVFRKLAKDCGLPRLLERRFGRDGAALALDLACFSLVTEDCAGLPFPDYVFRHRIFAEKMRRRCEPAAAGFLRSVTSEQIDAFLKEWNAGRPACGRIHVYCMGIGGSDRPEAPADLLGGRPFVACAVARDPSDGEPLFYGASPCGRVGDIGQLQDMLTTAGKHGRRDVLFVLDGARLGETELRFLDEGCHPFVLLPRSQESPFRELMLAAGGAFEARPEGAAGEAGIQAVTVTGRLGADDPQERRIHIYLDPAREAREREDLEEYAAELAEWPMIASSPETIAALEDGRRLCGLFCIAVSGDMSASEALAFHREREAAGRLLRGDKQLFQDESLLEYPCETGPSRLFVEFLALVVRERLRRRLRDAGSRRTGELDGMTVPGALAELERIAILRGHDRICRLDRELTGVQKAILAAAGVTKAALCREVHLQFP